MKLNTKAHRSAAAAAVLMLLAILAPAARAKRQAKAPEQSATVIAHVALEGAPATQMFLQRESANHYLYIDQGSKQGFTVVDVTKPWRPNIIKHVDSGKLQIMGSGLALSESPDTDSKTLARSRPPSESVRIMDMTDPAHPKTVQSFTGVTAMLHDDGEGLIYLTNNDGLWVLKHVVPQIGPARQKQPCTSESAIAAMPPDCE